MEHIFLWVLNKINFKFFMQDFDDLQKVLELLEAVSEELYISGVSLNMSHEDFQLDSQI